MPTNPLNELPGYALRRASAWSMSGLAQRLQPLRLTPVDASVLVYIQNNPGVTQSEVGRALGIVSANMAPLVARLEQREMLERAPVDGRSFGLRVTRRGAQAAVAARKAMDDQEKVLLKAVPVALRPAFKTALRSILDGLEE